MAGGAAGSPGLAGWRTRALRTGAGIGEAPDAERAQGDRRDTLAGFRGRIGGRTVGRADIR